MIELPSICRWHSLSAAASLLLVVGCTSPAPSSLDLGVPIPDDAGLPADLAESIDASPPGPPCLFSHVLTPAIPDLPTTAPTHLWSSGRNDLWMIGSDGKVGRFDGVSFPLVKLPTSASLTGISGSGPSDVWISGDAGTLVHWNGTAWSRVAIPTTQPLGELWAPRSDRVWVLTAGTFIYRWDGTAFHADSSGTTQNLNALWGILAGDGTAQLWAVGNQATVVAGQSPSATPLAPLPSPPTQRDLKSIWGSGPNDIWVGGGRSYENDNGPLYHWNGTSWSGSTVPSFYRSHIDVVSIWGSGPNDVWASGPNSIPEIQTTLLHWDGTSWTEVPLGPQTTPTLVAGSGAGDVFAVGSTISQASGYPRPTYYFYRGDASGLHLVAGGYTLGVIGSTPDSLWSLNSPSGLHWDGTSWKPMSWSFVPSYQQLFQINDHDAWSANRRSIVHWDGTTMTTEFSQMYDGTILLAGNRAGEVWTWDGTTLTRRAGGSMTTETCTTGSQFLLWHNMLSVSAGDVWIFGNDPSVKGEAAVAFHRTPTGCTLATGPGGFFHAADSWAASATDAWVVGDTAYHFDGTSWSAVDSGIGNDGFYGIWGLASDDIWGSTYGHKSVHWDGHTWSVGQCGDAIIRIGNSPGGHWAVTSHNQILTE